jgi:hypothetical protein
MMSKFMIVALAAAGASQQNNKRSAEEKAELKQLQRQSTAQLRSLNKTETEKVKAPPRRTQRLLLISNRCVKKLRINTQ